MPELDTELKTLLIVAAMVCGTVFLCTVVVAIAFAAAN